MIDHLIAKVTVEPAETSSQEAVVAEVTLINAGEKPVTLNLAPLSAPALALELVEARGAPVRLPPPPVPGDEVHTVELAAGKSYPMQFKGFVPQWLPVGTYYVRVRYVYRPSAPSSREWTGQVFSDWAEFHIIAYA